MDGFTVSMYFTNNSSTKRQKMQHFQLILIILGILAILAVLVHGYMLGQKEKALAEDDANEEVDSEEVIADNPVDKESEITMPEQRPDESFEFSHSIDSEDDHTIDFTTDDEAEHQFTVEDDNTDDLEEVIPPEEESVIQDVFVFNVVAREGATVRGHEILQFFLTAGFRFGEMSIFHRHQNSDGTGPVLFSIANMMQPGTFNLDKMEQFSSQGVSFFLSAPNEDINIKKAFDMMLVAVEQMAEEFDCIVLNEQRTPLTEEEFRDYHKRLLRYC